MQIIQDFGVFRVWLINIGSTTHFCIFTFSAIVINFLFIYEQWEKTLEFVKVIKYGKLKVINSKSK